MLHDKPLRVRKGSNVKGIIKQLELKFGSLRKAGEELGIDHQKLSFWKHHALKQREFLEAFEQIRKALKIRKGDMWGRMLNGKDEEE